jgi:hypothetical protein
VPTKYRQAEDVYLTGLSVPMGQDHAPKYLGQKQTLQYIELQRNLSTGASDKSAVRAGTHTIASPYQASDTQLSDTCSPVCVMDFTMAKFTRMFTVIHLTGMPRRH